MGEHCMCCGVCIPAWRAFCTGCLHQYADAYEQEERARMVADGLDVPAPARPSGGPA